MPHSAAERKAFWQIHFCVLLWGFTAILGKLITLPAQALVVWRMLLVSLFLAILPKVWRGIRALPPKLIMTYAGIGTIVSLMLPCEEHQWVAILPKVWRGIAALPPKRILTYAGISTSVALHWLTFYAAIKLSNASVAVSCLALGSIFTAVVEPVLTGRKHDISELILGIMVVPGVVLLVGGVPSGMHLGIVIGIISSFLTAVFATLNKRYVHDAEP